MKRKIKLPVLLVALAVIALLLLYEKLPTDQPPDNGSPGVETVTKDVFESEKDKILHAVPEQLRNNYFLQDKEVGCCKSLSGKMAVTVILVSDSVSTWDEESVIALKEDLNTYAQDIVAEAAVYNTELSFVFSYHHATLSGDIAGANYSYDWQNPALSSAGLPTFSNMHDYAIKLHNAKEAPLVFALNKQGRAYAAAGRYEYMVLFSNNDEHTFQHELSHLFGANDFYYPTDVMDLATTYLAESVMNSGAVADALTAYVIGWTDILSDEAKTFLEQTNDITEEYISAERDKESFTGTGTKVFPNGTYTGDMVRGVRHGTGTMQYNNGGWYTGEWSHGDCSGFGSGKLIYENGDVYEGEFKDGKRHGQGTYMFSNGETYIGNWVNEERHGYGTYNYSDGSVYAGNWVNEERHGYGTYNYSDGSVYAGNWKNGEPSGNGTGKVYYDNGVYEGQFYNGDRHGQGTYTFSDGGYYTGGWENGEKSGAGTGKEYYSNGVYEGQFYNGNRHGQGTYTWDSGDRYSGQWTDGKRTGYGTYTWPDGSSKTGNWQDGEYIG